MHPEFEFLLRAFYLFNSYVDIYMSKVRNPESILSWTIGGNSYIIYYGLNIVYAQTTLTEIYVVNLLHVATNNN